MLARIALAMKPVASATARRTAVRAFGATAAAPSGPVDLKTAPVVEAKVVDSLEWTLTSPPPVHQFDEPPIIVEVAHLVEGGDH